MKISAFIREWYYIVAIALGIVVCIHNLVNEFTNENDKIELSITKNYHQNEIIDPIKTFENNKYNVDSRALLTIRVATIKEKILYDWEKNRIVGKAIFIAILICIFIISLKLRKEELYKTDFSLYILAISMLCILNWFCMRYQADNAQDLVAKISNNEYKTTFNAHSIHYLYIWVGIIILWLGNFYKKAFELNKQQEFTI